MHILKTLKLILTKIEPQSKIHLTFLFDRLHINNVSAEAIFTATILLCMRSAAKPANHLDKAYSIKRQCNFYFKSNFL